MKCTLLLQGFSLLNHEDTLEIVCGRLLMRQLLSSSSKILTYCFCVVMENICQV